MDPAQTLLRRQPYNLVLGHPPLRHGVWWHSCWEWSCHLQGRTILHDQVISTVQCEDLIRTCLAFNIEERIPLYSIMNHPWMKIEKVDQLTGRYNCESEIVRIDPVGEKYYSCSTLPHKRQTHPISVPSANFSRNHHSDSVSSSLSSIWFSDE